MSQRIEDFGEKIGGAKKDLWKTRALNISDLDNLNIREYEEHVRKEHIWPVPDYKAYLEKGMEPVCIYFMKLVRDKLPAKFNVRGDGKDRQRAELFIEFINNVKDCCERLRKAEDILKFKQWLMYDYGYRTPEKGWTPKAIMTPGFEDSFLRFIHFSSMDEVESLKYECMIQRFPERYRGDLKGLRIARSSIRRGYVIMKGDKILFYDKVFSTPEEALKYVMEELIPALDSKKNEEKKRKDTVNIVRPQLEHIVRHGPDIRKGMDVSPEHMLEIFKFRGGEFGNWNNQLDRQAFLNYAFDAFVDLAYVLRAPLDFISLGGFKGMRLAIAFGSRGSGNALAHYEPGRVVINLTKMRGAGCLAHEWAHAFDDFLGVKCASWARGVGLTKGFLSSYPLHDAKGYNYPEVVEAFIQVMREIKTVTQIFDEEYKGLIASRERVEQNTLRPWLNSFIRDFKAASSRGKPTDEEIMEMERLREMILTTHYQRYFEDAVALYKKVKGVLPPKQYRDVIYGLLTQLRVMDAKLEFADRHGYFEQYSRRETDYYKESRKLDINRSKPYYSLPWEMFARAFEAFVEDELRKAGIVSQYLVHSTSNECYGEYKPYPEGEDRARINKAMRRLVDIAVSTFSEGENRVNFSIYENFKDNSNKVSKTETEVKANENLRIHEPLHEAKNEVGVDVSSTEKIRNEGKKVQEKDGNMEVKTGNNVEVRAGRKDIKGTLKELANTLIKGNLAASTEQVYEFLKVAIHERLRYGAVVEDEIPRKHLKGKSKSWTSNQGVVVLDSKQSISKRLEGLIEAIVLVKCLSRITNKTHAGMIAEGVTYMICKKLGLDVRSYVDGREFTLLAKKEKETEAYINICEKIYLDVMTSTGMVELFR